MSNNAKVCATGEVRQWLLDKTQNFLGNCYGMLLTFLPSLPLSPVYLHLLFINVKIVLCLKYGLINNYGDSQHQLRALNASIKRAIHNKLPRHDFKKVMRIRGWDRIQTDD